MSVTIVAWTWPFGWRRRGELDEAAFVWPAIGYAMAFGVVLAGGIHFASDADWSGLARSRAGLADVTARIAEADRTLTRARRAKPPANADITHDERAPDLATLMLQLAELAASSGLRLQSLEPQSGHDALPDGGRTVRVVADGDFSAMVKMVDGLSRLPVLAGVSSMRIGRSASALRVEMSVDVFPALPGGERGIPEHGDMALLERDSFVPQGGDPFVEASAPQAALSSARLAGVVRDARAALALFDSGAGAIDAVAAGERVGGERVVHIDAAGVMLATPSGPRRIELDSGRTR